MRLIKLLFFCHLVALAFVLCGLLLVAPQTDLWDSNQATSWLELLRFASSLQIVFGTATMLFFGWFAAGLRRTLVFFAASLLISFFLGISGIFSADLSSASPGSGLGSSFFLLSWFYMGVASSLLAWKLVIRFGLTRQTLWSLLLGTYFLLAWAATFHLALTKMPIPLQMLFSDVYGSRFELSRSSALDWVVSLLIFLGVLRLLWWKKLDVQHLAIGLPFGVYTVNIGFVIVLSFGMGSWLLLLFSALFVLVPETLAFYPREDISTGSQSWARTLLSQGIWLIMRGCTLVLARNQIKLSAHGLEHIPRSGPVLLAARHFHHFYDGYALMRLIPRRLHVVVALDWLQAQGLRLLIELACELADWPVLLRGAEMKKHSLQEPWTYQPNESRRYLRQVMRTAMRLLRAEEVLAIFPEGYPNIDPHPTPKADLQAFLPFQSGLIRLAELAQKDGHTRVAIVPVGLDYTRANGQRWLVDVRFGAALYLEDFASSTQALQAIEKEVRLLSYTLPPSSLSEQSSGGATHS